GNGQSGLRLDESVFDGLRAVFALDDHIGFGKALGEVAVLQMIMLQTVAVFAGGPGERMRDALVQDWRVGQRGLFRAGDDGQRLVVHFDQIQRFGRNLFGLGDDERDRISHVANLVVTQHRPVDLVYAAILAARYVVGGE